MSKSRGWGRVGPLSPPALPRALYALATLGPVGRVPVAPGTAASLATLVGWVVLVPPPGRVLWAALAGLAFVAVAAAGEAAKVLGTADPSAVVIDEVLGIALALTLAPRGFGPALAAFAVFRVLDVVKPFPLRWLERLPGGWGIVADDVGAALYAAGAVRLAWLAPGLS